MNEERSSELIELTQAIQKLANTLRALQSVDVSSIYRVNTSAVRTIRDDDIFTVDQLRLVIECGLPVAIQKKTQQLQATIEKVANWAESERESGKLTEALDRCISAQSEPNA